MSRLAVALAVVLLAGGALTADAHTTSTGLARITVDGATIVFGLVHGFGFAGALGALELPRTGLAAALALFNLGVEAGQMVVISALLPLLAWSRQRGWEPVVVRTASVVLVVLGLVWAVERLVA